jgi:hypothetical protein
VQTPESYEPFEPEAPTRAPLQAPVAVRPRGASLWEVGRRMTWVSGLVLAVSAFTGWYVGSGEGVSLSVVGWSTGTLGKLVFFVGLVVVALVALREAGIELPATVPESLVVISLGSLATIFVLIRLIQPPDEFLPADGRSIGLWISLLAALAVIGAGLLQASEEL